MTTLLLARHGQASFGEANYDALSPLGYEQARVLGESLRDRLPCPARIASGTLVRQRETARTCLVAMGLAPAVETLPGLDELDHMDVLERYEPRYVDPDALGADLAASPDPHGTFQRIFSEAMHRWLGGRHDGDYREPFPTFRARSLAVFTELTSGLPPGATVLAFTSAGPITVAVQQHLGLPHDRFLETLFTLANGSLSTLAAGSDGLRLASWNDHAHFEGEGRSLLTYR